MVMRTHRCLVFEPQCSTIPTHGCLVFELAVLLSCPRLDNPYNIVSKAAAQPWAINHFRSGLYKNMDCLCWRPVQSVAVEPDCILKGVKKVDRRPTVSPCWPLAGRWWVWRVCKSLETDGDRSRPVEELETIKLWFSLLYALSKDVKWITCCCSAVCVYLCILYSRGVCVYTVYVCTV